MSEASKKWLCTQPRFKNRGLRQLQNGLLASKDFISFQENVAIVVFGAKTQVLHRLSTDYFNIRRSIGMHSNLFSETSCPALSIVVIYIWIVG